MRDAERQALTDRERELERREQEVQARLAELEASGARPAAEAPSPEALPLPMPAEPAGVTKEEWIAAQKEIQEALLKLRGTEGEIVLPTATNVRDLKVRVTDLEEAIEKIMEEKQRLEGEIDGLRSAEAHAREVLKEVDDLLGKLPEEEIRRFARSEAFKRYEALMEWLGL